MINRIVFIELQCDECGKFSDRTEVHDEVELLPKGWTQFSTTRLMSNNGWIAGGLFQANCDFHKYFCSGRCRNSYIKKLVMRITDDLNIKCTSLQGEK